MGERERLKESEDRRVTAEASLRLCRETMAMMQRDLDRALERAGRAEAALTRVVEIGDGVGFDVAVKALREAGLMDPEDDDEEEAPRG